LTQIRIGSNEDANANMYSCYICAQMCSKYDIYFTFALFLIPLQINKFDVHLRTFASLAKNDVYV